MQFPWCKKIAIFGAALVGGIVACELVPASTRADVLNSELHPGGPPKDVHLGRIKIVHLKVPSEYIGWLDVRSDGTSPVLQIATYLPDMVSQPVFRSRLGGVNDPAQIAAETRRAWLFLTLKSTEGDGEANLAHLIAHAKKSYIRHEDNSSSTFEIYDSLPPYSGKGNEYNYNSERITYYIPKSGQNYVFSCDGDKTDLSSCHADFYYQNEIQVDVLFKPINFPRAQSIVDTVKQFISKLDSDAK